MTQKQPEALRLADALDLAPYSSPCTNDAAGELRRLQALNAELLEALVSIVNSAAANQAAVLYPLLDDAREAIAKAKAQK